MHDPLTFLPLIEGMALHKRRLDLAINGSNE